MPSAAADAHAREGGCADDRPVGEYGQRASEIRAAKVGNERQLERCPAVAGDREPHQKFGYQEIRIAEAIHRHPKPLHPYVGVRAGGGGEIECSSLREERQALERSQLRMAPRMAVSPLWRDCHRGRGNHGSRLGALTADHRPYALTSDFHLTTAFVSRGFQTMSFYAKTLSPQPPKKV